jgi:hypothetical protein
MERLPLRQGGVDGVNGGDFPPTAAVDWPLRRWKKGSASDAASENYGKNRMFLFYREGVDHNKTETRRPLRARWAWVAGMPGGPHHLSSFEPHGSSCVLRPLQVLLV